MNQGTEEQLPLGGNPPSVEIVGAETEAAEVPNGEASQSHALVSASGPVDPMRLLEIAVTQGVDTEKLEKLMALQERWEANQARQAFVRAMAAFKADPPVIGKDRHVNYTKKDGSVVDYHHAGLAEACAAIIAGLSKHELSHRWETEQAEGKIRVTCVLTHAGGHSERTTLASAADDSGGKNSIQAIGSAVTYLQRYTLLAATGLAAGDNDGAGANGGEGASAEPPRPRRKSEAEAEKRQAGVTQAPPTGATIEPGPYFITNVTEKTKTENGKTVTGWIISTDKHIDFLTFDKPVAELARTACEMDQGVRIEAKQRGGTRQPEITKFVIEETGETH